MKKILFTFNFFILTTVFSNAQNTSPYWSLAGNSNATSSSKLGTTNGVNLLLYTNNSEKVRITTTGFMGIGTTGPTERLHINSAAGANAFRAQIGGSTKLLLHSGGGLTVGNYTNPPANGLYVSGNVGVGTNIPSQKLHVVGRGLFTTGITVSNGGISSTNTGFGTTGVYGSGMNYGVHGDGGENGYGVYGVSDYIGVTGSNNNYGIGVYGYSYNGTGVRAVGGTYGVDANGSSYGVYAYSESGYGGNFHSDNNAGIVASTNNGSYAGEFYGNVFTSGSYLPSDKNLKQNIQEVADAMSLINKLKPQNYEYKKEAKFASLHLPSGTHYGLMAQDLEQVLPNLVSEASHRLRNFKHPASAKPGKDGKILPAVISENEPVESIKIKAVNYAELIPIIVKAMQEQDAVIQKQNAKIESLSLLINKLTKDVKTSGAVKLTNASLSQSAPNPSNGNTRINYSIPAGTKAGLVIDNEAGATVKKISLSKSGFIDIDTSRLSSGTYFYTLFVDDIAIDTKKMLITR